MLTLTVSEEFAMKYLSIEEVHDFNKAALKETSICEFKVVNTDRPILYIKVLESSLDDGFLIWYKDINISILDLKTILLKYIENLKEVKDDEIFETSTE